MDNKENKIVLSFIVPALNEEANIEATVKEIGAAIKENSLLDYEIILINDCSVDSTPSIMERLADSNRRIKVIHNKTNLGLGGSYKRGLIEAQFEYVMLVPGDNAWPSDSLGMILSKIGQADMVIPYITDAKDKSFFRFLVSKGFTFLINILFGLNIRYYNGLVVHRKDILNQITITTNGFAYQAEALVKLLKNGYSYVEVGTPTIPREGGKSKALRLNNLYSVLKTILCLKRELNSKRNRLQ